jgi:3-carboxy-cis,cis-muconate cycloisomerase
MSASLFERTLSTAEMEAVFSDAALLGAMLEFESALAVAEAAEGQIPAAAEQAIVAACRIGGFDVDAIVAAARQSGTIVVPLVAQLKARVAHADPGAAAFVHRGSTSQDAIDTAMVLATRRAMALVAAEIDRLVDALFALARRHAATPMLGRTLLQPARAISFGWKVVAWLAPLVRARARLARASEAALQLQLGGAVGTLAGFGDRGAAIARRVGERLGLAVPAGAWHVQRDAWVGLGCEVAELCGSLGKIGRDLALLAQAEVGEVAEPSAPGRGSSSAMPHKRNPVAALIAIAAATRAPQIAATLLAAMPQEHERGLGDWQAELAQWPALFLAAHGALRALADACGGLDVDVARMRANLDRHLGAVAAGAGAAPAVDIDAEMQHAGAAVQAQLDALQRPSSGAAR